MLACTLGIHTGRATRTGKTQKKERTTAKHDKVWFNLRRVVSVFRWILSCYIHEIQCCRCGFWHYFYFCWYCLLCLWTKVMYSPPLKLAIVNLSVAKTSRLFNTDKTDNKDEYRLICWPPCSSLSRQVLRLAVRDEHWIARATRTLSVPASPAPCTDRACSRQSLAHPRHSPIGVLM